MSHLSPFMALLFKVFFTFFIFLYSFSTLKSLMIISMHPFRVLMLSLSILSIFMPSRTLIFLSLSKRKDKSLYLPYRDLIIPFWFTCSMRICILSHMVTPSRWLCLVSPFRSPLCQSSMYSTCLDLMSVFLPSFQRYSLSFL